MLSVIHVANGRAFAIAEDVTVGYNHIDYLYRGGWHEVIGGITGGKRLRSLP
jgi:hypothetical protein